MSGNEARHDALRNADGERAAGKGEEVEQEASAREGGDAVWDRGLDLPGLDAPARPSLGTTPFPPD